MKKKMVKAKKPTPHGVFPPLFKWGKNPAVFFQKNKYLNLFKKQVCLIVIIV